MPLARVKPNNVESTVYVSTVDLSLYPALPMVFGYIGPSCTGRPPGMHTKTDFIQKLG